MNKVKLIRKRFIPNEVIKLDNDEILLQNDEVIVTKWTTIHPRKDFARGKSCYFLKEGYKISEFFDENDSLIYYYCDIIDVEYNKKNNTYTFADLLADVIVYKDGRVEVVDLAEISDALDSEIIDINLVKKALRQLDKLLKIIYSNKLNSIIEEYF